MNNHTSIPTEELAVFKKLPNLKVIFDVGSRDDTDYIRLKPKAEVHCFEPNHIFFEQLKANLILLPKDANVFASNFGLSNKSGTFFYNQGIQTIEDSEAWNGFGDMVVHVSTLNKYIKQHNIKQIDFLKIDTEGNDYKVLLGGKKALPITLFIQYEHWNDKQEYHDLLEPLGYHLEYIGYRNVLCINTKLVDKRTVNRIVKFIRDNKYGDLV